MQIPDGYHPLAPGKIASIVTYLEMTSPPDRPAVPPPPGYAVQKVEQPDLDWYRTLYRRIGENWLWFSRILLSDERLRAILHHPQVDVYVLKHGDADAGLLEMDRRTAGEIELMFFGLTAETIGKGAGRYLIDQGIRIAWSHQPSRFWLHTCTLDSPQALGFYQKAGFRAYKRAVEVADDPRLTGKLPSNAGSWIPTL